MVPALLAALSPWASADTIPLKEVGGLPIMRCKIHYGKEFMEAHVLFDVGQSVPLIIHQSSVGGIGLSAHRATGELVDIEFNSATRWKDVPIRVASIGLLEDLTMKYATELQEVPVLAIVGLPAIQSSVVELNLRAGTLRTLGMASKEASENELDYEPLGGILMLEAVSPLDTPTKAILSSRTADSILEEGLLRKARAAGKKPNALRVGDIQFGDQVPFRFQTITDGAANLIQGVIGATALRNYTVTIWPERHKVSFLPHPSPPPFSASGTRLFHRAGR